MSTYYCEIDFVVPCSADEAQLLADAINCVDFATLVHPTISTLELESDLWDVSEAEDMSTCAEAEIVEDGVRISGDECHDFGLLTSIIRQFAPSALPFGFTYVEYSSKSCEGSSGGSVIVTAEGYDLVTAESVLRDALAAVRAGSAPQKAA